MQQEELFPDGLFGRTSSELCLAEKVTTLRQSSKKWLTSGAVTLNGPCWTRSSSESPKNVAACSSSLNSITQNRAETQDKYLLSEKAVRGIYQRETTSVSTGPTDETTIGNKTLHHRSKQSPLSALLEKWFRLDD